MLDIVGTELAEAVEKLGACLEMHGNQFDVLSFIPGDNIADTNLV